MYSQYMRSVVPEDISEDDPEDISEDDPEDEPSTRKRKSPQTLTKGPFSKPSGYLPQAYYYRQQKSLTYKDSRHENDEDAKSDIVGQCSEEGLEEDDIAGQSAEEDSEEDDIAGQCAEDVEEKEDRDIIQEGKDGSKVAEKKWGAETGDERMPSQLLIDPGKKFPSQTERGMFSCGSDIRGGGISPGDKTTANTPNKLKCTTEQPTAGYPAPGKSLPDQQRSARPTFRKDLV